MPAALTKPAVNILPVALIAPPAVILLVATMPPPALIVPLVNTLPLVTLPAAVILPLILIFVNSPTEVILGCAAQVTVIAVFDVVAKVAAVTKPLTLAPVMFEI